MLGYEADNIVHRHLMICLHQSGHHSYLYFNHVICLHQSGHYSHVYFNHVICLLQSGHHSHLYFNHVICLHQSENATTMALYSIAGCIIQSLGKCMLCSWYPTHVRFCGTFKHKNNTFQFCAHVYHTCKLSSSDTEWSCDTYTLSLR